MRTEVLSPTESVKGNKYCWNYWGEDVKNSQAIKSPYLLEQGQNNREKVTRRVCPGWDSRKGLGVPKTSPH